MAEQQSERAARVFMWIHYGYLLALPALAMFAVGVLDLPDAKIARICGFFGIFFYLYIVALLYEIPNSLPHTTILAFSTPVFVGIDTLLLGDSVWHFFLEDAAIEIGAFSLAIAYAFVRYGPKDQGIGCVFGGIAFGVVSIVGLVGPILGERLKEHPLSIVLFLACLWWAFTFYRPMHDDYQTGRKATGTFPLRYESTIANRLFPRVRPKGTIGPDFPEPAAFLVAFAVYLAAMLAGFLVSAK